MTKRKQKGLFNNKRVSLQDIIFAALAITIFAVSLLIGSTISSRFNTEVQTNADFDANARTATAALDAHYGGVMDNSFFFLTVGLAIATLMLAGLVRVHPMFIPLFFVGLVFVIFLSAIMSNIFQEMALDPNLAADAARLDTVSFVMTALPFFVGIFGILLMMVMYKIWRNDN